MRVLRIYGPTCERCYYSARSGSCSGICSSNGWNAAPAEPARSANIRGSHGINSSLSTLFFHTTARVIHHREKGLESLLALSVERCITCPAANYLGDACVLYGQSLQHKWTGSGLCAIQRDRR